MSLLGCMELFGSYFLEVEGMGEAVQVDLI